MGGEGSAVRSPVGASEALVVWNLYCCKLGARCLDSVRDTTPLKPTGSGHWVKDVRVRSGENLRPGSISVCLA